MQQKRPGLNLQTTTTRQLKQILEEIFIRHRIIAFERYNFISRKQRKNETLEQFHADLVEPDSRADCGDNENEWVGERFTAHMNNEKIAEEMLAETRTPQEAYEYAISREKGIENSKNVKLNPIGTNSSVTIKQEPIGIYSTQRRSWRIIPTIPEQQQRKILARQTKSKHKGKSKPTFTKLHHTKTMLQIWKLFWPEPITIMSSQRPNLYEMSKRRTLRKSVPFGSIKFSAKYQRRHAEMGT